MMSNKSVVPTDRRALLAGLGGLAAGSFLAGGRAEAGPLVPPTGPASTPGPEPRTALSAINTPGTASSVFRIVEPGSYYLTGNISGQGNRHGIVIAASNVTLDLMGFSVIGGTGNYDGIATEGVYGNIIVRNGTVSNWGSDGINLTSFGGLVNMVVEKVAVSGCGVYGIRLPANSIVRDCAAYENGNSGISLASNGLVSNCVSRLNGGTGISTHFGCSITGCSTYENVVTGIQTNYGCSVTGCSSYNNGLNGIAVGNGSVVSDCAVHTNDGNGIVTTAVSANGTGCVISNCSSGFNNLHGISATQRSLIKDNACVSNGSGTGNEGAGIYCSSVDNRIDGNNCTGNTWGIRVANSGNFITRNTCSGNTTNWEIAANNVCLVLSASVSAAISGNSGGVSPGSTNPNANFTF